MKRLAFRLLAAVATLGFSPAVAQQAAPVAPAPGPGATITVTARADARKTIEAYVAALTSEPGTTLLARFERPICPSVTGIPDAQKEQVLGRMRKVAAAVARVDAAPRCDPNLMLIVTADKPGLMRSLEQKKYDMFGGLSLERIRRLVGDPSPVSAWHVQGPSLSARGQELRADPTGGVTLNRTTEPASRMTLGARPQFGFAVVVVDAKVLEGLSPTQLADYATLRGLAAIDPASLPAEVPSILRIIDAPANAEVPLSMTAWDLSFLRGLYGADLNLLGSAQRSAIAREMEKSVAGLK